MSNKGWIIIGTVISYMIVKAMTDELKHERKKQEKMLIETTTRSLTNAFIKDLEDKNNVRPELRLVK